MSTPAEPRHSANTKTTDPSTADPTDTTAREEVDPDSEATPVEPTAGRTPTAAPAAAPWAVLLALVVLALGVVGIREPSSRPARSAVPPGPRTLPTPSTV